MKKIKMFLLSVILSVSLPLAALAQWDPWVLSRTSNLPGERIYNIIGNLMMWILGIFGFVSVIGFAVSGIMYLTAAGNEDQINKAKSAMKWSIVGVIVGIGGLVVVWAVDNALRGWSEF